MGVRLLAREIVEGVFAGAWDESKSSLFRVISKRCKAVSLFRRLRATEVEDATAGREGLLKWRRLSIARGRRSSSTRR